MSAWPGLLALAGSAAFSLAAWELFREGASGGRLARLLGRRPRQPADPVGRLLEAARRRLLARRRREAMEEAMEAAILEISEALRAGASIFLAVEQAARHAEPLLAPHLEQVLRLYRSGVSLSLALRHLEEVPGCEEGGRRLGQVLRLHRRTGGDPRLALARLSESLRRERQRRAQQAARTAEARWTAHFLAALPPLIFLYMVATGASPLGLLGASPAGRVALAYALLSWLAGIGVVDRLTRTGEAG
ncbi:MAG: type II secretion system F family protein [Clostridia bacterium]|nr:type II secretion system F family protein [Clostridia bacterium]